MHFVNTYRQERRKQHNQEFSWKKRISRQCTIKPGNTGETMQPRDKIEREREQKVVCLLHSHMNHLLRLYVVLAICILCCVCIGFLRQIAKERIVWRAAAECLMRVANLSTFSWVQHELQFNIQNVNLYIRPSCRLIYVYWNTSAWWEAIFTIHTYTHIVHLLSIPVNRFNLLF